MNGPDFYLFVCVVIMRISSNGDLMMLMIVTDDPLYEGSSIDSQAVWQPVNMFTANASVGMSAAEHPDKQNSLKKTQVYLYTLTATTTLQFFTAATLLF